MKSAQEECVLCCRDIFIYATGKCDHPVCYECSTRMRVLCETNECPICRSDMPVVVFTKQLKSFSGVDIKAFPHHEKYQIVFEDETISKKFDNLLENKCKSCGEIFPNFNKLKEHVRRIHELHYCELCTDNLKIFTFERKCYNRKDLARHKRLGDPDETSHRGHPLCEFCDQRYVDRDDLFRHLRREHYFCHFCDADGKYQYYRDYDYLRVHFRKEHFVCEEGDCINEKFTAAFRTEIDLKAHVAVHHIKNKSKAEAKQARLLDFEFPLAPHNRPSGGSSSPRGGRYNINQYKKRYVEESGSREKSLPNQTAEAENIDTQSVQEFPFLGDDVNGRTTGSECAESMLSSLTLQSYSRNPTPYRRNNIMSAEEFPALCSTSEASNSQNKNIGFNRLNNMATNISSKPSQKDTQNSNASCIERKLKIGESKANDKVSQQVKWIAKKNAPNFEDEFPLLQTKKNPSQPTVSIPVCTPLETSAETSKTKKSKDPEASFGDQFIVIKNKSKKKKPKLPPEILNNDSSSKLQSFDIRTSSAVDDDYECQDNFKKHMVPPTILKPKPKTSDTWVENVSFQNDDFPPLLAPSAPPKKPPPGFKTAKTRAPPPGFPTELNAETDSNSVSKVLSLSSVGDIIKQSCNKANGVDNSTSHSEQNNCSFEYKYVKPPNFQDRNLDLINRIINLPSVNPYLFQEFKQTSGQFRSEAISASEFHDKCLDILGRRGFLEIFAELVTLLPDIGRQQELLTVHNEYLSQRGNDIDRYPIVSCTICNQVLIKHDYSNHVTAHASQKSQ